MDHGYIPSKEKFLKDVKDHKLHIERDDGLYRHLKLRKPDEGVYWIDIITWPGVLAINSDCGTYVFARLQDMFQFFRRDEGLDINPSYWAEKVLSQDKNSPIRRFDSDKTIKELKEYIEDWPADAKEDLLSLLGDGDELSEDFFIRKAMEGAYSYEKEKEYSVDAPWELATETYTYHYIWCCRAIAWAIEQYDKAKILIGQQETV